MVTKSEIAKTFKEIIKEKSFDKITIQDITVKCGLNRQTFYYHFEDRNDLIKWIYYNDVFLPFIEVLREDNFYDALLTLLNTVYNDRVFYENAFSLIGDNTCKSYLYSIFETLVMTIAKQDKESLNVCFYTNGLYGIIVNWVKTGMEHTPEELANQVTQILNKLKS